MRRAIAALTLTGALGGLAVVGGASPASAGMYDYFECVNLMAKLRVEDYASMDSIHQYVALHRICKNYI
ncbi:MAG: hypothetical protein AB7L84_00845 [Acidimicrobiia bacterium]